MQAYKIFFKLFKRLSFLALIYLTVFALVLLMTVYAGSPEDEYYSDIKVPIALINQETNSSDLTKDFIKYLKIHTILVETKEADLNDAFFYRDIYASIIILDGFSDNFGKQNYLKIKIVENSANGMKVINVLDNYMRLALTYLETGWYNANEVAQIMLEAREKLQNAINIEMANSNMSERLSANMFFKMAGYVATALIITLVGLVMFIIRQFEIQRRITISSVKTSVFNLNLIIANFILVIIIISFFFIIGVFLNLGIPLKTFVLLFFNMLCLGLAILGIAYFISLVTKSINVINAFATIISLGGAFISGMFVSQSIMDTKVLMIGRFLPQYYFVKSSDLIMTNLTLTSNQIQTYLINCFIMLGFALLFVVLSLMVARHQRKAEA